MPLQFDPHERMVRRLITLIVTVVLVVTTISAGKKIFGGQGAVMRWWPQVTAMVAGENVYGTDPYPNTPAVAVLLYPLAKLPPTVGAFTLYLIKVAMAALAVLWAVRLASGRRGVLAAGAVGLILLLCARPIMSDLQHGNINILVLFLVMAALYSFARGREFLCGLLIGLAAVVKVTPALFVPYFLYKRKWTVLAGAVVGGLAALLAPAAALGWNHNIDMHIAWFDVIVRPYALEGRVAYTDHINQSLPGVFYRWFTDSPGVTQSREMGVAYINVLSLDPSTARAILRGVMLALLAWLVFVCRTPTTDARDWRLACEFSLVLIAMLLFSERSWKHHYVTMTLPFAVLVAHAYLGDPPAWLRRGISVVLVFALVMMLGMSGETIGWMYRGIAHKWVEGFGSYFWFATGSFIAISMILLNTRRRPGDPAAGSDDPG